jgi:hypothetical protein
MDRQQRWISVKERLPEKHQDVLCYGEGFQDEEKNRFYVARHSGNEFLGWSIPGIGGLAITYWIPLPEPPNE